MNPRKTELNTSVKQWVSCSAVAAVLAFVGCAATEQPRGPLSSGVQKSGFLKDL